MSEVIGAVEVAVDLQAPGHVEGTPPVADGAAELATPIEAPAEALTEAPKPRTGRRGRKPKKATDKPIDHAEVVRAARDLDTLEQVAQSVGAPPERVRNVLLYLKSKGVAVKTFQKPKLDVKKLNAIATGEIK